MQRREKTYLWIMAFCFGFGSLILLSPVAAGSAIFYGAFIAACAAVVVACRYAYRFVHIVDRDRFRRAADLSALADVLEARREERRSTERSHPGSPD